MRQYLTLYKEWVFFGLAKGAVVSYMPEPALLRPNEPTVADWFLLVNDRTEDGAYAWYGTLPAGKYELTIQRRLACCDGPMVESNKISFEVVP